MNTREIQALALILRLAADRLGFPPLKPFGEVAEALQIRIGRKRARDRAGAEAWLTMWARYREG